jgi:hypothetical protein
MFEKIEIHQSKINELKATDFTTSSHVTCNGCYFYESKKSFATCVGSKHNLYLLLAGLFGHCYNGNPKIFILRQFNIHI